MLKQNNFIPGGYEIVSENKPPAADLQICIGIMRLAELKNHKLMPERMSALFTLGGQIKAYQKEFAGNPLALDICAKKIEFILQAQSKSDLKEILSPPKVRYNGNEVVPVGNFHVEEEELLIWSLTSLWCGGPLSNAGFKRYMRLFAKFYPDMAKEIGISNHR
jgi:hypothetical protein